VGSPALPSFTASADSRHSRIIKDAELEADWLPLSSVRHKPAGKVKGRASDEAGRVGSQVNQGTSQVIGLA
jgi:hypothetical protein